MVALDGGPAAKLRDAPAADQQPGAPKVIDPIALATLIVAVPCGVLAVVDLVDRIRNKRPKAQIVVETAQRLRLERQIEVTLLTAEGSQQPVADLDADRLLALVAAIDRG